MRTLGYSGKEKHPVIEEGCDNTDKRKDPAGKEEIQRSNEEEPQAIEKISTGENSVLDVSLDKSPKKDFPIVGIGASAGGLAAFEAFFSAMPSDTDPGVA
jgi:two-component system CheB/CheR fusion protein